MKKYKLFIFFVFLLIFIPLTFIFAQKELEVEYPGIEGFKPETIETPITYYVKYIFNFAILFVGLLVLLTLIWSGVQYLTSTGKPDVLSSAKSRIKSAFLGILILLFSYLILITINPQLTIFQFPGLKELPQEELPKTPISPLVSTDLLGRIKELAEIIKTLPDLIDNPAKKIQELANNCDCKNTQPLCFCTGGGSDNACQPRYCYAGPGIDPCPAFKEIKNYQTEIVAIKDEIIYYRNRVIAEKQDLIDDLEIISKDIEWYNNEIGKIDDEKLKKSLEEERDWLLYEKGYKKQLQEKLQKLADAIAKIEEPVNIISQLPDKCLENVKEKCQASCKTGENYGCHDKKEGCQPDKCSGGNPCPIDEIQNQAGKITSFPGEIIGICNEIITVIENIEKTRERTIEI